MSNAYITLCLAHEMSECIIGFGFIFLVKVHDSMCVNMCIFLCARVCEIKNKLP